MTKAIVAKDVVKRYKLYDNSKERILDLFSPSKKHGNDFYALNGVSFEADKGDVVGFIGINGSGKSTLSNIIAGIVPETSGTVQVNGQPSLIAVAAGLNDDLTGRDNIELKCLMLGFTREEVKEMELEIIEFSELENFIDQPVKSYSSGMKSRLGFAISVKVDPDILIIDEALSVGDRAFADKSLKKMMEFKEEGKTMIFVSHSIGQMKTFCDKILWLEFGRVKAYGDVQDVLPLYEAFLNKWQNMQKEEKDLYREKVMSLDPKKVKYKKMGKVMVLDNEDALEASHTYSVRQVSRLAHLKAYTSYIYQSPNSDEGKEDAQTLKNKVYYVKREATYQFENYYLLSTKPSGQDGVIGWIRGIETSSHVLTHVDNDPKVFYLLGKGYASTDPWGGKKQYVHESLEHHAGLLFNVSETVLVGNNIWYRGKIDGTEDLVCIHSNNVVSDLEELDTD